MHSLETPARQFEVRLEADRLLLLFTTEINEEIVVERIEIEPTCRAELDRMLEAALTQLRSNTRALAA